MYVTKWLRMKLEKKNNCAKIELPHFGEMDFLSFINKKCKVVLYIYIYLYTVRRGTGTYSSINFYAEIEPLTIDPSKKYSLCRNWPDFFPLKMVVVFILFTILSDRFYFSGNSDVPRSLSTLLVQARSMLTIRVHIFASRPSDNCSDDPLGSFWSKRGRWKTHKKKVSKC